MGEVLQGVMLWRKQHWDGVQLPIHTQPKAGSYFK